MRKKIILSTLAIILWVAMLSAQTAWKTYTSTISATSVTIDGVGNAWVGTSGGLYRYEKNFKRATTFTNSEGLADTRITTLEYDALQNAIWVGAENGAISRLNVSNLRITNSYEIVNVTLFAQKSIRDFALSGDSLYAATDFGALLYTPSRTELRETYLSLGNFPTGTAAKTILLTDSLIVVGTEIGLATASRRSTNLVAPDEWKNITLPNVTSLSFFNKKIYVGTRTGLFIYNPTTGAIENVIPNKSIISVAKSSNKLYALATDELLTIADSMMTRITVDFTNATSIAVASDEMNDLLISDRQKSLLISNATKTEFEPIRLNTPLANRFEALSVDSKGRLWVSSSAGNVGAQGIYRLEANGEEWTNFPIINAQGANGEVKQFSSFIEQNGNVILGCWGNGLLEFISGDSVRGYSRSNSPLTGIGIGQNFIVIPDLAQDANDAIWLANYLSPEGALAARLSDGTFKVFAQGKASFPAGVFAFRLTVDNFGRKWVATRSGSGTDVGAGIIVFDDKGSIDNPNDDELFEISEQQGFGALPSNTINDIQVDLDGALWIATPKGAAYYFDASIVQENDIPNISALFDLEQENLTCLAIDALNQKWFGSTNGVWLTSSDGSTIIEHYVSERFPLLSNNIISIAIDNKSGKVYIGTDRGLSVLQTASVTPTVKMSDLKIYPNPVLLPENQVIQIQGLSRNANVKIITISGRLVRDLKGAGGGSLIWDGKDNQGEFVASGVYFAVGISENGKESGLGKIAVIRRR